MNLVKTNIKHAPVEKEGLKIKTPSQIERMREAGAIAALSVKKALDAIEPGITTVELDSIAKYEIESMGATPAFLGLYGFPATTCISINEEIVHGIPGERALKKGDIVSIDCGAIVGGMYSDTARTALVQSDNEDKKRLLDITKTSLDLAIATAMPGSRTGDLGSVIEEYVARYDFNVVREYVGHGVGEALHEPPQIPNFGNPGSGVLLPIGAVIAIEPMVNIGTWRTRTLDDGWTVVTADGSLSAHFEDTVAITVDGPEVLTSTPLEDPL